MRTVVASLAAALAASALAGCVDGGAEPGASDEATVVLDFTPNAVHAGLYAALADGEFQRRGVELEIREPSASTDGPKLLAAGRVDFAILDINDLGLARERGLDVVAVASIVQRPLAALIAADREEIRRPRDLEGGTVGVTGLPSDDAVLDAVLQTDGVEPDQVDRVTIGFGSVAALSAGRLDAATAFWNAEGVALRRLGVPTREFRLDDFGAPAYPELVLAAQGDLIREDPRLVGAVVEALAEGYEVLGDSPKKALDALLQAVPALERSAQQAQLDALIAGRAFDSAVQREPSVLLDPIDLLEWLRFALRHQIVSDRLIPTRFKLGALGFSRRAEPDL